MSIDPETSLEHYSTDTDPALVEYHRYLAELEADIGQFEARVEAVRRAASNIKLPPSRKTEDIETGEYL